MAWMTLVRGPRKPVVAAARSASSHARPRTRPARAAVRRRGRGGPDRARRSSARSPRASRRGRRGRCGPRPRRSRRQRPAAQPRSASMRSRNASTAGRRSAAAPGGRPPRPAAVIGGRQQLISARAARAASRQRDRHRVGLVVGRPVGLVVDVVKLADGAVAGRRHLRRRRGADLAHRLRGVAARPGGTSRSASSRSRRLGRGRSATPRRSSWNAWECALAIAGMRTVAGQDRPELCSEPPPGIVAHVRELAADDRDRHRVVAEAVGRPAPRARRAPAGPPACRPRSSRGRAAVPASRRRSACAAASASRALSPYRRTARPITTGSENDRRRCRGCSRWPARRSRRRRRARGPARGARRRGTPPPGSSTAAHSDAGQRLDVIGVDHRQVVDRARAGGERHRHRAQAATARRGRAAPAPRRGQRAHPRRGARWPKAIDSTKMSSAVDAPAARPRAASPRPRPSTRRRCIRGGTAWASSAGRGGRLGHALELARQRAAPAARPRARARSRDLHSNVVVPAASISAASAAACSAPASSDASRSARAEDAIPPPRARDLLVGRRRSTFCSYSRARQPANGRCVWQSTNPGITAQPVASTCTSALGSASQRGDPAVARRSPSRARALLRRASCRAGSGRPSSGGAQDLRGAVDRGGAALTAIASARDRASASPPRPVRPRRAPPRSRRRRGAPRPCPGRRCSTRRTRSPASGVPSATDHLPGVDRLAHARRRRRGGSRPSSRRTAVLTQRVEQRPVGDRVGAVAHRLGLALGRGDRARVEVVAPDHDRRP